jgi:hypothetical protein
MTRQVAMSIPLWLNSQDAPIFHHLRDGNIFMGFVHLNGRPELSPPATPTDREELSTSEESPGKTQMPLLLPPLFLSLLFLSLFSSVFLSHFFLPLTPSLSLCPSVHLLAP